MLRRIKKALQEKVTLTKLARLFWLECSPFRTCFLKPDLEFLLGDRNWILDHFRGELFNTKDRDTNYMKLVFWVQLGPSQTINEAALPRIFYLNPYLRCQVEKKLITTDWTKNKIAVGFEPATSWSWSYVQPPVWPDDWPKVAHYLAIQWINFNF